MTVRSINDINDLRRLRDQSQDEDALVQVPNLLPLTLKRTSTANGLYKIDPKGALKVGHTYLAQLDSIRQKKVIDKQGNEHIVNVVNIRDETGRDLGWIWAELFYL